MIRIKNARLLDRNLFTVEISNGMFCKINRQSGLIASKDSDLDLDSFSRSSWQAPEHDIEVDAKSSLIVPAAVDVHVHSRDPGFSHKEDWKTLANSAFKGGVVGVVDMPNTLPSTMDRASVLEKAKIASDSGLLFRILLGVGPGNLDSLAELLSDSSLPLAGIKVYYGQSTGELMFNRLDLLSQAIPADFKGRLVFHSEDQCRIDKHEDSLKENLDEHRVDLENYSIHSKVRDSESAWTSTREILQWAIKDGRDIHLAHVSTPDEIEMLESAKRDGLVATCEVSPHHLLISTDDYDHLGSFAKVNPPVRKKEEVLRLRSKLAAGLIDCFATDHAPHTREEKQAEYFTCPSGIPSIEFYWPLLFKSAEESKAIIEDLAQMACQRPAELFGFQKVGKIEEGYHAHFVWLDEEAYTLTQEDVEAKCQWSPYVGKEMSVRVRATWKSGKCVYRNTLN